MLQGLGVIGVPLLDIHDAIKVVVVHHVVKAVYRFSVLTRSHPLMLVTMLRVLLQLKVDYFGLKLIQWNGYTVMCAGRIPKKFFDLQSYQLQHLFQDRRIYLFPCLLKHRNEVIRQLLKSHLLLLVDELFFNGVRYL